MKHTFFLVHGAWSGGWCWDKLRPMLEAEEHSVLAPDLPGHGMDNSPIEEQTLDTYAKAVEALITQHNAPVILVGHSFGGIVASQAAANIPNKIKKLVYIAAFLPQDGQSCSDLTKSVQPTFREKLEASGHEMIMSADDKISKLAPESFADFVFSDIPRETALEMATRFGYESNDAQRQAVSLGSQFHNIPKAYVRCTLDRTIDISLQDKMIAGTHCDEVYTLDTGHCPFESNPRRLADLLLSLGDESL